MPIGRLEPQINPLADRLRDQLTREWKKPSDATGAPIIIKDEGSRRDPSIRLYVIWDSWQGLSQQERSEIIMDAYTEYRLTAPTYSFDEDDLHKVTVAMGLTSEEAARMGLRYTIESAN